VCSLVSEVVFGVLEGWNSSSQRGSTKGGMPEMSKSSRGALAAVISIGSSYW
jgi:hypothetical protein